MTGAEQGFLLLTSHLGDPDRKVLTVPQFRILANAVSGGVLPNEDRELMAEDLMGLGFNRESAQRILVLLSHKEQLQWYLENAVRDGCLPVTRISSGYPLILRKRLGLDSPGCLWLKGDPELLQRPCIALVGSRQLRKDNLEFAREAGCEIAKQGFVLVSGNAKGADTVAQEACLAAGGSVISVVADCLAEHPGRDRVLYVSEDGFDLTFSSQRALSRNRVIHCLGEITLVAQCTFEKGGTWDGTTKNLRFGWSDVFCFRDGSSAFTELCQRGANAVEVGALRNLSGLLQNKFNRIEI